MALRALLFQTTVMKRNEAQEELDRDAIGKTPCTLLREPQGAPFGSPDTDWIKAESQL